MADDHASRAVDNEQFMVVNGLETFHEHSSDHSSAHSSTPALQMTTAASILGLTLDPLESNLSTSDSSLGLLIGPSRSGKTSLAFAAARVLAARLRAQTPAADAPPRSVWFACQRAKIEACLPAPVAVNNPAAATASSSYSSTEAGLVAEAGGSDELECVAMKYFASAADLKGWCLRVHELDLASYPAAFVLDDLDLLLDAEVGGGLMQLRKKSRRASSKTRKEGNVFAEFQFYLPPSITPIAPSPPSPFPAVHARVCAAHGSARARAAEARMRVRS
jgi:hypothetical protein